MSCLPSTEKGRDGPDYRASNNIIKIVPIIASSRCRNDRGDNEVNKDNETFGDLDKVQKKGDS